MYCLTGQMVVLEVNSNFRNRRKINLNIGVSQGSAEDKDWSSGGE